MGLHHALTDVGIISLEASTRLMTTAGLPERERFLFWHETACNLFGADTLPGSGRPFFADLTTTRVKEFAFSHGTRCYAAAV